MKLNLYSKLKIRLDWEENVNSSSFEPSEVFDERLDRRAAN